MNLNRSVVTHALRTAFAAAPVRRWTFDLAAGAVVECHGSTVVGCRTGLAWLTGDRRPVDVVLSPGRRWRGRRGRGRVVATAMARTRLTVWSAHEPVLLPAPQGIPAHEFERQVLANLTPAGPARA